MPLPRTDAYLDSIGEHVEDLSRIAATQPFRTHGPTLTREALAFLATRSARSRRGAKAREPGVVDTLTDAELTTADGELTEAGRTVAGLLTHRHPRARLRIESGRGSTPLTFDAYADAGRALVVANPSPAGFEDAPHGDDILTAARTVHLDLCDVTHVPLAMAAWVGLAPAWSLATSPELLDEELIRLRADDPAAPPPDDADENLRHVWAQPWFLWTLQASGVDTGRVMVNAGRAGQLALMQADEKRVRFAAVLSYDVWFDLVAIVERSVTAT